MGMTAAERRRGPDAKIKRAKKHLLNLNKAIERFDKAHPHHCIIQQGDEPRRYVWRLADRPELPPNWALIVGDIAHNARAALDHLAWQLVDANSPGRAGDDTAWPIVRKSNATPLDHRSVTNRKLRDAHPDVIALALDMEFYDGGKGHHVWQLDQLDLIDKHRLLLVVDVAIAGFRLNATKYFQRLGPPFDGADATTHTQNIDRAVVPTGRRRVGDDGEVFAITLGPTATTDDFNVALDVAIDALAGMPSIKLLSDLVQASADTVEAFIPYL